MARQQYDSTHEAFGGRHHFSIRSISLLAIALVAEPGAARADALEAEALLAEGAKRATVLLGPQHPLTLQVIGDLGGVRRALARRR